MSTLWKVMEPKGGLLYSDTCYPTSAISTWWKVMEPKGGLPYCDACYPTSCNVHWDTHDNRDLLRNASEKDRSGFKLFPINTMRATFLN